MNENILDSGTFTGFPSIRAESSGNCTAHTKHNAVFTISLTAPQTYGQQQNTERKCESSRKKERFQNLAVQIHISSLSTTHLSSPLNELHRTTSLTAHLSDAQTQTNTATHTFHSSSYTIHRQPSAPTTHPLLKTHKTQSRQRERGRRGIGC